MPPTLLVLHRWKYLGPLSLCEQVQNYVSCQGHFSSPFSVVGSVNFRTRLERPLVRSMGDSEIFHVQLLKMVTKNDPGNYDTFVLVHKHCGSCICEFYGGVCMFELVCQLKGRRNS